MTRVIAPTSIDADIEQLLREVDDNTTQLPEFQRNWIWDDLRIRALIASISQGYPMGVIMRLEYGDNLRFQYRTIEGAENMNKKPSFLILDGQQRMTSIYCAAYSSRPVVIHDNRDRELRRYYYLDINKCLDPNAERIEAVISVPEDRKLRGRLGEAPKDLSSRELEYQHEMFPLNIIFDGNLREDWADGYKDAHNNTTEYREKYKRFRSEVLDTIVGYKLPVITLLKNTPKEAVCKVFENVNTGGVTLTVFELVTASFAADEFNLRADWEKCRDIIRGRTSGINTDLMDDVDEVAFLTAITLYVAYENGKTIIAPMNKHILNLPLKDYKASRDAVLEGYEMARNFLFSQCVFRKKHIPYAPQVTILATICAIIGRTQFNKGSTKSLLSRWFWCGVLGEMYGNLTFSSYTNDIEDIPAAIAGNSSKMRTINSAFFSATRLITLTSGTGAAYKGIIALMFKSGCRDLVDGSIMDVVLSMSETPDIHHIFPKAYCEDQHIPKSRYNSVINKTPLLASSNRLIGKNPPDVYSRIIVQSTGTIEDEFRKRVESNFIDYDLFIADDFEAYFIDRAKKLLRLIEQVMGKPITDKDSAQTIGLYGASLA